DRRKQGDLLRRLGAVPARREGRNPGYHAPEDRADGCGRAGSLARAEQVGGAECGGRMTLNDMFAPDEQGVENRIDVERAIGRLTFREATVLYVWAVCEKTQEEIGDIVGLSQRRIGQIIQNISKKP